MMSLNTALFATTLAVPSNHLDLRFPASRTPHSLPMGRRSKKELQAAQHEERLARAVKLRLMRNEKIVLYVRDTPIDAVTGNDPRGK